MLRLGGRWTALLLAAILGVALSGFSSISLAKAEEAYTVKVIANCDIDSSDITAEILLDGTDSGFSTPHEFTGLVGFHNFSLANEHVSGHFIKGPPAISSDPPGAASQVISEGVNWILIGPSELSGDQSGAIIRFTYGPTPFIESFRGTVQPGAIATIGVEVHMDPARVATARLDIYNHSLPIDVATTSPFFMEDFILVGVQPTYIQFQIPENASAGQWGYELHIAGANLDASANGSFEVGNRFTPVRLSFPSTESLPYSYFDTGSTRFAIFDNPNSSAAVLYVGGGIIGNNAGPTPIDGYSDVSDWGSGTSRLLHDLIRNGFSVVIPAGPWAGLGFPSAAVAYLRNLGKQTFYAIGHSAGGVIIANSIVDHPDLFSKAIIADAPLTLESTGYYFTDLSIRSEQVKIPHLLVWGRGDQQAGLENAFAWLDHANKSLATLEVYDYDHDWAGTTAETQVRKTIINFLTDEPQHRERRSQPEQADIILHPSSLASNLLGLQFQSNVQGALTFRDLISRTQFGSALLNSAGKWLSSGSSWFQQLAASSPVGLLLQHALDPLGLMFEVGSMIYSVFPTESGAIMGVTTMSWLFGALYFGLPLAAVISRARTGRRIAKILVKPTAAILSVFLVTSAIAVLFGVQPLLAYSANALMISAMLTGALLSSNSLIVIMNHLWHGRTAKVSGP